MCKKPTLHYKGSFSKVTATDRRDGRRKGSAGGRHGVMSIQAGDGAFQGGRACSLRHGVAFSIRPQRLRAWRSTLSMAGEIQPS